MTKRILTIITTFSLSFFPFILTLVRPRSLLLRHFDSHALLLTNHKTQARTVANRKGRIYDSKPSGKCMSWVCVCWLYTFLFAIRNTLYKMYAFANKQESCLIYLFIRIYLFNGPIKTLFRLSLSYIQMHTRKQTLEETCHAKIFICMLLLLLLLRLLLFQWKKLE